MKAFYKMITGILIIFSIFVSSEAFADTTIPDVPRHGQTGDQSGGGAPLGGGLFVLLGLGAAYGSRKVFNKRKGPLEE